MRTFLVFTATLVLLLLAPRAMAWDLVELGDISIEHKAFTYANSLPFTSDHIATSETNLNLDIAFLGGGYLRNKINSMTDPSQYRLVGWNWELGARVTDWLEVGYWHFSRHELDGQSAIWPGGTKEDGVIIRLKLYKGVQPDAIW